MNDAVSNERDRLRRDNDALQGLLAIECGRIEKVRTLAKSWRDRATSLLDDNDPVGSARLVEDFANAILEELP